MPITALRVTPPSCFAIWLAESPSCQSFLRSSTRSSVQPISASRQGSRDAATPPGFNILWRPAVSPLSFLLATFLLGAGDNDRYDNLGHAMICTCGCRQILLECNHVGCQVSDQMTRELRVALARGDARLAHRQDGKRGNDSGRVGHGDGAWRHGTRTVSPGTSGMFCARFRPFSTSL